MDSRSTAPTVTVLTPRGRSAVAVVSARIPVEIIDAQPSLFRAANGRSLAVQPINRVCYGRWEGDPVEEVVVCRVDPHTVEICCHGGIAAVSRIVRNLESRGARATTSQALLRERNSLVAADCLEALTQASTIRAATIVLEQSQGVLEQALTNLLTLEGQPLVEQIESLLSWSGYGRHLTQPWQVVLTGAPNAGKSSLINRLVGYQRSIVYAEPGTTRDVVTAAAVFDGWPVVLSDTAGLRESTCEIEAAGIRRARQQLANADLAVLVLDRSRPINDVERRLLHEQAQAIVVEHKADLPSAWASREPEGMIAASSLTGEGIDRLITAIAVRLVPTAPSPGTPIPVSERQIEGLRDGLKSALNGNIDAAHGDIRRLINGKEPMNDGRTSRNL
jgi:tRNA modification GTPase